MFNPVEFIKETRNELGKVTWPTKEQAIRLTGVVILVSLLVSLYLDLLHAGFNELLKLVIRSR